MLVPRYLIAVRVSSTPPAIYLLFLTLTLLVPRICTNHAQHTMALDDFAMAAKPLDRC